MHWMLMPLKRYADFSGRSRRMEFWMWQLLKFLFSCVIWILIIAMVGTSMTDLSDPKNMAAFMADRGGALMLIWMICMVVGLGIFIPDLAVSVRRLHDTNRSGWWILAPVAPYIVMLVVAMASMGSTMGTGRPEPSGIAAVIAMIALLAVLGLALMLIVFYFLDGTPGPNRFGPDPKGRGSDPGIFA